MTALVQLEPLRRTVELTIDGEKVQAAGRADDPRGLPPAGHRYPDALLPRDAASGQRLPGVRRRSGGLAGAGALVRAKGRGGDGGADRLGAGAPQPQDGARVPRLVGGSLDHARRRRLAARSTGRRPSATGRRRRRRRRDSATACSPAITRRRTRPIGRRSPSRPRWTTSCTSATTASASSATSASRPAARTSRTPSPSPSRDAGSTRGSRPSSPWRCPSRRASTAATASPSVPTGALMFKTGVRPPGRRHLGRVPADGDPDGLPVLRRRLQPGAARAGQRDRAGDLAARPRRDPRQSLHQGPVRLAVRAEPRDRCRRRRGCKRS